MAFEVEYFTLNTSDASNGYLTLLGPPAIPDNVAMDVVGGTAQALTGDFGVDGSKIRWDSTAFNLHSFMAAGDKVRVIYDRT